jgi:hypothetical protein
MQQAVVKPETVQPAYRSAEEAYRTIAKIGRDDRSLRIEGSLGLLDHTWKMSTPVDVVMTPGGRLHLAAHVGLQTVVELVTNGGAYQMFVPSQSVLFGGQIDRCVFASAIGAPLPESDVRAIIKGGVPLLTRPSELNLDQGTLTIMSMGFREVVTLSAQGQPLTAELYSPLGKLLWKVAHDRTKETNTEPRLPKFTVFTDGKAERGFRLRRGKGTAWDITTDDPFQLKDAPGIRRDSLSCR